MPVPHSIIMLQQSKRLSPKSTMSLDDAIRIARILEADDVISVPAKACRILVAEIDRLEKAVQTLNALLTQQAG